MTVNLWPFSSGSYEQLPKVKLESLDGTKNLSNIMGQRSLKRYFVTTELTMPNVPVKLHKTSSIHNLKMSLKGVPLLLSQSLDRSVSIDFLQEDDCGW